MPEASAGPPAPVPNLQPDVLAFSGLKPGETRRLTFFLGNSGGPCSRVKVSRPRAWLIITRVHPLSPVAILPLEVEVEVKAEEWDEHGAGNINVWLDKAEAHVRVELAAAPAPAGWKPKKSKRAVDDFRSYPTFREWLQQDNHRILAINIVLAYILYLYETRDYR